MTVSVVPVAPFATSTSASAWVTRGAGRRRIGADATGSIVVATAAAARAAAGTRDARPVSLGFAAARPRIPARNATSVEAMTTIQRAMGLPASVPAAKRWIDART